MSIIQVIYQLCPTMGERQSFLPHRSRMLTVPAQAKIFTPVPTFVYLQYLRGVAALLVVYFHAVVQMKNIGINAALPQLGDSGVDLFFVLSGFLMWVTTSRTSVTPICFMRRRLIRILPLYWALTLTAGAMALIAPQLLKHTVVEFTHFVASLVFFPFQNPGYLDNPDLDTRLAPVLVPGWTLNYEMFFYVVFACFLSMQVPLRLVLITAVFVLLCAAGAIAHPGYNALGFYTNPIILEFVFGIVVAVLVQRHALLRPALALTLLAAAIVLLIYDNISGVLAIRVLAFGVPAALIVYSLCCLELTIGPKHLMLLKALGDASYSLYLTHVFTLVLSRLVFARFTQSGSLIVQCAFVAFSLALSSLVALGAYQLYEKPLAHLLRRFK